MTIDVSPAGSLLASLALAASLSPTAGCPIMIQLGAGCFIQGDVAISIPHVTIRGAGMKATRIVQSGASALTITTPHVSLAELSIEREGTDPARVLHCDVTSLAAYLIGIRFDNVAVKNAHGTAVGTLVGESHGCDFRGIVAVDWIYGGRCYACTINGHDPTLAATSYAVRTIQSAAEYGGHPRYFADESFKPQRAELNGCRLVNTDPHGVVVNGVTEDEGGDRWSKDWHYQLQQPVPLYNGQPCVSWFPPPLIGCYLLGPQPRNGSGPNNEGTISRTGGTGAALRGTLRVLNCEVYGFYLLDHVHDTDVVGGIFVNDDATARVISMVQASTFIGTSFIFGEDAVNTSDGLPRVSLSSHNHFNNCHFQGETAELLQGNQYMFNGCTETTFGTGNNGGFGWDHPRRAARLNGLGSSFFKTVETGDYAAPDATFELWFRCDALGSDSRLLAYEDPSIASHYTAITVNPSAGQIYAYAGGVLVANASGQPFADSQWHHAALVIGGGSATFFLDGVALGTASGVVVGGTSTLRIGAGGLSDFLFRGDVANVRISKAARYAAAFTPQQRFILDADTLSLWGDSTDSAFVWTDQTGRHDAAFASGSASIYSAPNIPYWVHREGV